MKFMSPKYKVLNKNNKSKSKWLSLIDIGDTIQFSLYSTGSRGSGTTYHLLINDVVQLPKEGLPIDLKSKNAFGRNILDSIVGNLDLKEI